MIFKIAAETYDTSEMLSLVINGIYLTVYLHPERRLAFVQTFEETSGVIISTTTPQQCSELLELLTDEGFPAILSHSDQLRDIVSRADNRNTDKNPSECEEFVNMSVRRGQAEKELRTPVNQGLDGCHTITGNLNPPEMRVGDPGPASQKAIPNSLKAV